MKNKLNQYIYIICLNFKFIFKFKFIIEKLNYKIIEVIKIIITVFVNIIIQLKKKIKF